VTILTTNAGGTKIACVQFGRKLDPTPPPVRGLHDPSPAEAQRYCPRAAPALSPQTQPAPTPAARRRAAVLTPLLRTGADSGRAPPSADAAAVPVPNPAARRRGRCRRCVRDDG